MPFACSLKGRSCLTETAQRAESCGHILHGMCHSFFVCLDVYRSLRAVMMGSEWYKIKKKLVIKAISMLAEWSFRLKKGGRGWSQEIKEKKTTVTPRLPTNQVEQCLLSAFGTRERRFYIYPILIGVEACSLLSVKGTIWDFNTNRVCHVRCNF